MLLNANNFFIASANNNIQITFLVYVNMQKRIMSQFVHLESGKDLVTNLLLNYKVYYGLYPSSGIYRVFLDFGA
jgi:hypothetical protein